MDRTDREGNTISHSISLVAVAADDERQAASVMETLIYLYREFGWHWIHDEKWQ